MSAIVAGFGTEAALEHALSRLRSEQIGTIDTYTPQPLEHDEPGNGSPIPLRIFVAGMLGAAAMFGLETYADVFNWPVNVGGRPAFSWPAFVPIAFEFGVLCAISAGFISYLMVNRLPRLWDPVDECANLRQASCAGWLLAVHSEDDAELARARRVIWSLHPDSVEEVGPALAEVPA